MTKDNVPIWKIGSAIVRPLDVAASFTLLIWAETIELLRGHAEKINALDTIIPQYCEAPWCKQVGCKNPVHMVDRM